MEWSGERHPAKNLLCLHQQYCEQNVSVELLESSSTALSSSTSSTSTTFCSSSLSSSSSASTGFPHGPTVVHWTEVIAASASAPLPAVSFAVMLRVTPKINDKLIGRWKRKIGWANIGVPQHLLAAFPADSIPRAATKNLIHRTPWPGGCGARRGQRCADGDLLSALHGAAASGERFEAGR